MGDVRLFFDAQCLFAYHLNNKEHTVTIAKVSAGELIGEGGRKAKKPMCFFEKRELPLALNKTNVKTIAAAYGYDANKWVGKVITLYPTTTQFGAEHRDCIRVKIPTSSKRGEGPPTQREPGQDDD